MGGFLWEMVVLSGKDFNNLKTCDNINSGASSEPVISDSLSQVLETMCYLVPFRGIDVVEESEPFRVSSTLFPNSITRDTITYFVDDQGHRLLTKGR